MLVKLKRIYEEKSEDDGHRILVDHLWPRGISKEKVNLDKWLKDIGPTKELRQSFGHDPNKFEEFKQKYKQELQSGKQKACYDKLKSIQKDYKTIILLFASKDEEHNQTQVLKEMLEG